MRLLDALRRSPNRRCRTRVWQWIKDSGGIFRRTIIDERRVSDDWPAYAGELERL